jgi:gluconate 5-dehydrogenase
MSGSPFDLRGRRALVTGSTRGIGAAIAAGLARAGAHVVVHGRDADQADQARTSLRGVLEAEGFDPQLHATAFDVIDHTSMLEAVESLERDIGGLDIVVNNAGMQLRSPLLEFPLAGWDQVLATNLTSCFVLTQAIARGMVARGAGKIINICSVQNKLVRGTTAPYAVAKAGLGNLTKVMCAEWAASGLQINGLAPGYIDTEINMALRADPERDAWIIGRTPAGRWGTPEDLAGPAVWLASDASDFVNGQIIYVDGGMTAVI